ncbi:MAG TPA: polyprenol monophosphomannose synthase [Anaerolineales bacterium]|nr:polyprenol monophosphomannose synthase [Anaerolineales bacterium]
MAAHRSVVAVVPTYNEVENLPRLAESLWSLPGLRVHLLVVDDGSPDGTGRLAEDLARGRPEGLSVLHRPGKLGLGTAYRAGFAKALERAADAIVQMDADFSHDPREIPGFVAALDHCDAVFGSRYIPGGRLDERWSVGRVALSRFGNLYARTILRLPMQDVTGGYRAWRPATLRAMPLDRIRSNGYVFQVEMAYVADRLGFAVVEKPIYFEDRRYGRSKMSLRIQVEAALRVWQVLWMHRNLRSLRGMQRGSDT